MHRESSLAVRSRRGLLSSLAAGGLVGLAGCGSRSGESGATATPSSYRAEAANLTVVEHPTDRGLRVELVGDANRTVRQTHDAFAIDVDGTLDGEPAGPDVLVGNLSEGDVRNRTFRDRTFVFVR